MSNPLPLDATPVTHKRQLIAYFESGGKPANKWLIGTEHEKFLLDKTTHLPVPYEGEHGIGVLMDELQAFGWQPIKEGETVIGLKRGEAAISLEPGGQFELSGAPVHTLHETTDELRHHLDELGSVARLLNIDTIGIGFHPVAKRGDVPWMPKGRYQIMRNYMPKVGSLGLDMMLRTCTVQVNLDYADEVDMARKFRVSLALQPVATALFANSPFRDGRTSGDLTFRGRVWQHTDPARCNVPEFVFSPTFGYEHYVDYALNVPMYFVRRNDKYIDVSGSSFRDFMQGKLDALPGEVPTMGDWVDHLSTLFPPVRLKKFLEMRGADMSTYEMTVALPALWTGLLYDAQSLAAAETLISQWSAEQRQTMYKEAPRLGLRTPTPLGPMVKLAREVVKLAEDGLRRRARLNEMGDDETIHLAPLHYLTARGITLADELNRMERDEWGGSMEPIFKVCSLFK